MKNKSLDICMAVLGIVLLVIFGASAYVTGHTQVMESKKVGSISEISIPEVPEVTTDRLNGVVSAAEWESHYPDIYASYMKNAENTGHGGMRISYVETDPDIQVIYDGMGFSFDYTEAIGHNFTLNDIAETTRPHKLANCLTCKTPDMTAMVNAMGKGVYSMDFDEMYAQVSEPVSCYNCHGNTPGTMVITHDYMADAMNDEIAASRVSGSVVSCAQCHIEYYFDPATKATSVPYDSLDNLDPDSILAFYNKMGFVDFTNKNTGVGMIKVQHPEFETFMGEGSVHKGMYTCADCHMGVSYNEKGDPYANHFLSSPLENEALLKDTCSMCHADLPAQVKAIQEEITGREKQISAMLVEINTKLAAAIDSGSLSEDVINQIKSLDRDAQFYWDFVYVENAEGAHNSALSRQCLDKAEALAKQALALLG
ncbi:MAG: ammonia-forming cytochrome c nitrite reductase subunit c552 [Oscillospiraceae bacterium]|nr:ammonia-forming cytochrome c nitrite reductase subunit c552 [Oscillospiraceae bacterium]